MKLEIDIHPAQAEILNTLLFHPTAKFSQLNKTGLTTDHFNFHIKRLQSIGLVEKSPAGYVLTAIGKEFANRLDTDEKKIERQAKLGALLVPVDTSGSQPRYLVQERLKHPFYGFYGFATGKIRWGETVLETAARELTEETGLTGELKLVGIHHKLDYKPTGELLEDKYFYVVQAVNLSGTLTEQFEGGRNFWLTEAEIADLDKVFEGMDEIIAMTATGSFSFYEQKYTYSEQEY
jgi:8-oxo-dGTP pyrophosphatase MutT (NUDIX family)